MITKRAFKRAILVAVTLYALGGILIYSGQTFFLFHPVRLPENYQFKVPGSFEEITLRINEKESVSILKFKVPDSVKKGTVIYYHGNMLNMQRYVPLAKIFTDAGYELWMSDYPGFGKTTGELTELNLYKQSQKVFDTVASTISTDSIIVYGKSLGTGIASFIASKNDCRMLILETPYYSMVSLFKHYAFAYPVDLLLKFKFPAFKYISEVSEKIVIMHGTKDELIPYKNSARLAPILKTGDLFITVEGASHNDVTQSDIYKNAIRELLK